MSLIQPPKVIAKTNLPTPSDCTISGFEFKLTCSVCPEQYDVFKDNQKVAYVRLRHGYLSLSNADISEDWFEMTAGDKSIPKPYRLMGDGCFDDDDERHFYLSLFAKIIEKKLKEPDWQADDDKNFLDNFVNEYSA